MIDKLPGGSWCPEKKYKRVRMLKKDKIRKKLYKLKTHINTFRVKEVQTEQARYFIKKRRQRLERKSAE